MIGAKRSRWRDGRPRLTLAPSLGEDIPEARRVLPLRPPRPRWQRHLLMAAAGAPLLLLALAITFQQPLRRWLAAPPVPGLSARLSADGRLLGHFPYVEAPSSTLTAVAPGLQVHRDAAASLLAMQRAARAEGVDLVVLSGYRSVELQKQLFFLVKSERAQSARERAQVSAPPGFSEHSTGYAVDLGDGRAPATNLSPAFEDTAAFAWLRAHAARYHFVLSFPRNNPQGVSYEPWHWRFEGTAEALQVFEPAQRLQP